MARTEGVIRANSGVWGLLLVVGERVGVAGDLGWNLRFSRSTGGIFAPIDEGEALANRDPASFNRIYRAAIKIDAAQTDKVSSQQRIC